jgi:hypothetical protein
MGVKTLTEREQGLILKMIETTIIWNGNQSEAILRLKNGDAEGCADQLSACTKFHNRLIEIMKELRKTFAKLDSEEFQ